MANHLFIVNQKLKKIRKMKKIVFALSLLAIIFTSCAQNKTTENTKKEEVKKETPVKPEHVKTSDKEIQNNIAKTMQDDLR